MAAQYPSFNVLKESYNDSVDVIAVPCSQFFNQEPGSPEEIMNALKYVRPGGGFVPNFRLMEKSDVNGVKRIPLYQWALGLCDSPFPSFSNPSMLFYTPLDNSDIRWNFEKILFDQRGAPYRRYTPDTEVADILKDIDTLLSRHTPKVQLLLHQALDRT